MEVWGKKVEIGSEVVGEGEEPELVGGADVQDAFESQGAGCFMDLGGRVEMNCSHSGLPVGVEGEHEAGIGEGVVLQGQVGQCRIATEIGIASLVDL
jgi:hypothetical protein